MKDSKKKTIELKPYWVLIAMIMVVIIALIATGQFFYQQRINKLTEASTSVWNDQATSLNGVSSGPSIKAPFFWEAYCVDTGPCPAVSTSWLVLIEPSQEASFIKNTLEKSGYSAMVNGYKTPGASGTGVKNGVTMSVGFYAPAKNDEIPYKAPEGKEWKSFGINVFETK